MKKAIKTAIVLICILSMLTGCGDSSKGYRHTLKTLSENLNFDFDFLQDMTDADMSGYYSVEGSVETDYVLESSKSAYYDKSGGEYVMYSVSPYPNYSSEQKRVTLIYCSDTSKKFFGVSLNSTSADIKNAFDKAGFDAEIKTKNGKTFITSDLGNGMTMGVVLSPDVKYFSIGAKVSENSHIVIDWK